MAQNSRQDGLSTTTQMAKASEHLVCSELLLHGWNAYIVEAQPYDILVDLGNSKFCRVQVKATAKPTKERIHTRSSGRTFIIQPKYRFLIKRSTNRGVSVDLCDFLALVALDQRLIAWVPVRDIIKEDGTAKMTLEFKSRSIKYEKRAPGIDPRVSGKFIEDYGVFDPHG